MFKQPRSEDQSRGKKGEVPPLQRISCPVAQVSNDLSRGGESPHKRIRHGDDLGKMAVPNSLASDDVLDELIKQQQFIARLEKLVQ